MTTFKEVHERDIASAAKGMRGMGECCAFYVRTPIMEVIKRSEVPSIDKNSIVHFRAMPDGTLEPASNQDRQIVAEWERKYGHRRKSEFFL